MNACELNELQTEIENEIYKLAADKELSNANFMPITDGVCNIEAYLASKKKIMWVLQEPYDDVDENDMPCGGEWSIPRDCFVKETAWANKTWQPIIYVMYGYLYNLEWDDMDWIRDNHQMAEVLKQIAFINVSKMPAYTTSPINPCGWAYPIWKNILHKQIEIYNPDIIIFCNTFDCFSDYFGNPECKQKYVVDDINYINEYHVNGKCLLWAYHPNNKRKGFKRKHYVNTLIHAIRSFRLSDNQEL